MSRRPFNRGWAVKPKANIWEQLTEHAAPATSVVLPHDALIGLPRDPRTKGATAYFPAVGEIDYTKTFHAPEEWRDRRVSLEFQGAYRDAMVFVNGTRAAHRPYGYSTFTVPIDDLITPGADNTVRVEVRTHEDSRWYAGAGLHRDVVLVVTELLHLAAEGVTVTTPEADDELAVVEVAVPVTNATRGTATVTVTCEITDDRGQAIAHSTVPLTLRAGETGVSRRRLYVRSPRRWSVDDPYLYSVRTTVAEGEAVRDETVTPLGIRTLRLDPYHGLRINGETVKLRGACIHHDNGVLGAAAVGRAEERRVELLKEAGFNALRSAHNPLSQAMLDACDRLGMLVMDEAFDAWTRTKSPHDYATDFDAWWERDLEAMVRKDRNHPSVVLYSIGNEIPEIGTPLGANLGRRLAEKVRQLDPTRPVTNAVNGFVAVVDEVVAMMAERMGGAEMESGGVNAAGDLMNRITLSPMVAARLEEALASVEVAGLNYAEGRYEVDRELYPDRIVIGTETFPKNIAGNWRLVETNPQVLGDFTWTGWDYLGEVGIGRMRYVDEGPTGVEAAYPWLTAGCGDLDITGHRRPQSYLRETVFGLRHEPYIAVQRPEHHGREPELSRSQWAWTDSLSTWSWDVELGTPVTVDVYSDADEVELLLNGTSAGRRPAGRDHGFEARFEVAYEPGELVAVAYTAQGEQARTVLRSAAGDPALDVRADRSDLVATSADLAFVTVELRDPAGVLVPHTPRGIEVEVTGAGVLAGLGTGRFDDGESFLASECTTYDGRALAVVRPMQEGEIIVRVAGEGLDDVSLTLRVAPAPVPEAETKPEA
ncbi:glycoside hydrolase family 2 TIM barrel-domain containing protein [Streptomyces sp. NPDC002643]